MLGTRLREIRKKNKLTQTQLAEKVGTQKGTISNYENGHSTPPNEMLKRISKVLNISSDYLLGISEEKNSYVKEDEAFYDAISDPDLKRWYKELPNSKEEDLKRLRQMWEIIRNDGK